MRASVISNTNRAVSSSEDSWGSIRDNTVIKFGEDHNYYNIGQVKSFYLIKDFSKIEGNILKINGSLGIDISEQDIITISFKEYELFNANNVEKGSGYKVSDVVFLEGGDAYKDPFTGEIQNTRFTVTSVDNLGGITQLMLNRPGRYYEPPNEECALVGGSGTGAKVKNSFNPIDLRTVIEKTVINIEKKSDHTLIKIDSPIHPSIQRGKLSINKWEMFLTSEYVGETQVNARIELVRDFSPNLRIPYLAKGSQSPETIYNLALATIDKEFGLLKKEIELLKSKIR